MKKIVLITTNKNKIKEYNEMFDKTEYQIIGLNDLNITPIDVNENKDSFKENSKIKILSYIDKIDLPIIADDSGIIIDEMGNNFPGVKSHRYANSFSSQKECNNYIYENFRYSPCHFTCSITLYLNNNFYNFEGITYGIIDKNKGENGFGYDSIFYVKELDKTYAELTEIEKNTISHRAKAFTKLKDFLKEN